jgi:F-type H+-transporting ATPase subunit epsilon
MPDTFDLEIATPERLIIHETVTDAQIPAKEGYIGVLPGHAPLLSELGIGTFSYTVGGHVRTVIVSGGFVEVLGESVRVLANTAELPSEIDRARAEASLKRAQERIAAPASAGVDVARALNAMKRAQARLNAATHPPHR